VARRLPVLQQHDAHQAGHGPEFGERPAWQWVLIGAGLALLLAPQSGKRTRRQLLRSVEGITDGATDRFEDVSDELRSAVRTGRKKFSF
jgi:hypothetical protein